MGRHDSAPNSGSGPGPDNPDNPENTALSASSGPASPSGMGLGMRMATDMVVSVMIGLGMGYYLDKWLDSSPWMTLLFFLFGSVAGFRAVYRAANAR